MTATLARAIAPPTSVQESPVQKFYHALQAWDFSTIKRYVVLRGIYSANDVELVTEEYRRWLSIALAYRGESVPISAALDPFWHTHIIFTEDYSAMGQMVAGRYIHHRPSILDSEDELGSAFSIKTLVLYREHFGKPDMRFWDSVLCRCGPTD